MELTSVQILLAIIVFIVLTIGLIKMTYHRQRRESGQRFWKTQGGLTNYLRVLVLVSLAITVIAMLTIKSF